MAGFAHVDPTYILLGTAMLANPPVAFREIPLTRLAETWVGTGALPSPMLAALAWLRVAPWLAAMGAIEDQPAPETAPAPSKPRPAGKLDALLDAANALEVQSVTVSQHDGWTSVHLTARQEDGAAGVERIAAELGAPPPVRRSNATHEWLATFVSPDESLAINITGDWRTR